MHRVTVATPKATDWDSGYNGQVFYSLADGDAVRDFTLTEINGTGILYSVILY